MNPLQIYTNKLEKGEIQQDTLQNEVVLAFQDLYQNLVKPKKKWFFKAQPKFYGLYIFGSVGRGKTSLMDLFVETIEPKKIRRQHFHAFMLWFHQQLRSIKNQQNPVDLVIKRLSSNINILCLDEFLVHDITDAMLLAKILFALEEENISLVTTSNVNPVDLYAGGLQREEFIPAIRWMQNHMKIMQLDGNLDYRIQSSNQNKKWFTPINEQNNNDFEHLFSQAVGSRDLHISPIQINKRQLAVIKRCSKHIMFEFETLCMQPRNASDYIQLTQQYLSIFMVINAAIETEDRNTARRFINLIDVLYDANTPLYVLSTVEFTKMYKGDELSFEMQRTVSRLTEMQNFHS
ncbi:MAG: AFG1 family ATPase [Proteobacteria bacterium]|nr:AFG1 family ATPase [Pseudomonadota bacterium]